MIIIESNAVHNHATMMIILNTARIAVGAMMHSRQFVNLAFIAKTKLPIILHLVVNYGTWLKIIIENKRIISILEQWLSCPFWRLKVIIILKLLHLL